MSNFRPLMIIEDDADIRAALRELLESEGYAIREAGHGREGLEALKAMAPSMLPGLILLDLMMPVMDGRQFLEECRKDPALASIPVIAITAAGKRVTVEGAVEILHKPIDIELILAAVERQSKPIKNG